MGFIFEVNDKTGRKIRLTKRQWNHMIKKHSYMEKYIEEIKETLEYPDKFLLGYKNHKFFDAD